MKLGITGKLFLVILATNVVIALAVGVAERVSFDRGFRDYMREREVERLATLADSMATLWRSEGSFDSLRGNEMRWQRYVRNAMVPAFLAQEVGPPRFDASRAGPPEPPAPADRGAPGGVMGRGMPPPPFGEGGPPGNFASRDGPSGGLALLDAQRKPVVGNFAPDMGPVLRPVNVEGKIVGYVSGLPFRGPFTGAEQRLAEQQVKASGAIAGFAVLLAIVVGYFLARGFIAPVRRLAAATHRIAAGDNSVRVASTRSDELGQLTADFNRLAVTLERNEAQRRNFMADISHELRTPLAVLRGELEALEDGIRTLTPERLRSLQAEVATLGKLVDDLYELSLADVGALALHRQRLDLREVVANAVTAFDERFAARGLAVDAARPAEPVLVEADARRITQVLNNLLENCARYTDAGGRVRVAVSRESSHAIVDVMDTAPGVPHEALPRLFDRLYRVEDSRNRKSGGAGLGLALAKGLVEGHGGSIVAQPSPLGGLWIRVTLPALA